MYVMSAHEPLIKFVQKLSSELIKLEINENMNYEKFFTSFEES